MRENPIYKWMMTRGTPILGNPHLSAIFVIWCHPDPFQRGPRIAPPLTTLGLQALGAALALLVDVSPLRLTRQLGLLHWQRWWILMKYIAETPTESHRCLLNCVSAWICGHELAYAIYRIPQRYGWVLTGKSEEAADVHHVSTSPGQANYSASNSLLDSLAAFWSCQAGQWLARGMKVGCSLWCISNMSITRTVCLCCIKTIKVYNCLHHYIYIYVQNYDAIVGIKAREKILVIPWNNPAMPGPCGSLVAQRTISAVGPMGRSGHGCAGQHSGTSQVDGMLGRKQTHQKKRRKKGPNDDFDVIVLWFFLPTMMFAP